MELWDAYDSKGNLLGYDLVRGQKLKAGQFHIVGQILIKHSDGSYLIVRRSKEKESNPLKWEASAGGSALKGEDILTCIKREIKEELDINCKEIKEIDYRVYDDGFLFYSFLGLYDGEKEKIVLQESECIDYKWLDKKQFKEFVSSEMMQGQKSRYSDYLKKEELI